MEINKVINGRRYHCSKIPVMKQLKLLPLMGTILDKSQPNPIDVDWDAISKFAIEHSRCRCENVKVGEAEIEASLKDHMDDHFEDVQDLMEVVVWILEYSFEKKK